MILILMTTVKLEQTWTPLCEPSRVESKYAAMSYSPLLSKTSRSRFSLRYDPSRTGTTSGLRSEPKWTQKIDGRNTSSFHPSFIHIFTLQNRLDQSITQSMSQPVVLKTIHKQFHSVKYPLNYVFDTYKNVTMKITKLLILKRLIVYSFTHSQMLLNSYRITN